MFAIYALTYTLPSLGSFMVEGYYNTTAADHDPCGPHPDPPPNPRLLAALMLSLMAFGC